MAPEQPVPHIQAMIICRDSEQDDGGTWNLYGVFRETVSLRYPARLTFQIFVQYTNAVGMYRFESHLLDLVTGATISSASMATVEPMPDLAASSEFRILFPDLIIPHPGRYECRLFANGVAVASAFFMAHPPPS